MNKGQLVDEIAGLLEPERDQLIEGSRSRVKKYISGQGSECLKLIEHKRGGTKIWMLGADPRYVARLSAFCVNRPPTYSGNRLDSGLTQPVVNIVTEEFEKVYDRKSEAIGDAIATELLSDEEFAKAVVSQILDNSASRKLNSKVRGQVIDLVLEQISQEVSQASMDAVSAKVSSSVASVAAQPITAKIALMVTKLIAANSKVIIAKIVASKAAKLAIAAAVNKFVAAAIVAALAKAFAAKFGISVAGATTVVLIPIILAYITYEIATFPEHLGERSRTSLRLNFAATTTASIETLLTPSPTP